MERKVFTAKKVIEAGLRNLIYQIEVYSWGIYFKIVSNYTIVNPLDRWNIVHEQRFKKNASTTEQKEQIIKRLEKTYNIKFNRP